MNAQRPLDLGRDGLEARARGRGADEVLVPVVHHREVGHAGGGERAHQVHRRRRVGVGADHPGRVGDARDRVGDQRVDDVAPVGGQAERVERGAARLGVLARDAPDLHHRQRRAVGEHDRHLQEGADGGPEVRLGVVDERLGAVAALEQERAAVGDIGQPVVQFVHFGRQRDRRDAFQHRADVRDGLRVGPLRLLRRGTGERVVQPLAQVGGQGRQLGQHFDGGVDGPVHVLRVEPRRGLTRSGRLARRRPFWLSPIRTDSAHLATDIFRSWELSCGSSP